jgi:membrane protein DedA with SNARE-associated domain
MTETLYALVSTYGLWVVGASAFLSCLAVPIPTSIVMLTAGAFAGAGDFETWQVFAVGWIAAVLGDHAGFQIGRAGGPVLVAKLSRRPARARLVARAQKLVQTHGATGVFLSTWLFAPLGPWVNLIAGAGGLPRRRFSVPDAAGEAIWVGAYTGLGVAFGARLEALTALVADWSGMVMALGVAIGLAILLWKGLARRR